MTETGKLVLVATPIGNLSEMTPRAVKTLRDADLVAAEDTRTSRKLFNHFDIKTPMESYHRHNEASRVEALLTRLRAGQTVALISDAGVPGLSDPGERIVSAASGAKIRVEAVGCASALVHALVVSGLPCEPFTFAGFLPRDSKERTARLASLADLSHTLVFYVTPHALVRDLESLGRALGDRDASLSRELTKRHEETVRATLSGLVAWAEKGTVRGEMVLVVHGRDQASPDEDASYRELCDLVQAGLSLKSAAQHVAARDGLSRRALYNRYLKEQAHGPTLD